MEHQSKGKELVFSGLAGVGCMVYNNLIQAFTGWEPGMIVAFGALTTGLSGYLIIKDFNEKNNDWNKLFRNCRIKNTGEQIPRLVDQKNRDNGTEYIFTIPLGLSEEDFEKKKAAIECFLKSSVLINRKGSTVSITALNGD